MKKLILLVIISLSLFGVEGGVDEKGSKGKEEVYNLSAGEYLTEAQKLDKKATIMIVRFDEEKNIEYALKVAREDSGVIEKNSEGALMLPRGKKYAIILTIDNNGESQAVYGLGFDFDGSNFKKMFDINTIRMENPDKSEVTYSIGDIFDSNGDFLPSIEVKGLQKGKTIFTLRSVK